MPDNVGYTPGSGATVAADDIGGVLYQRVKPVVGADGSATDVSSTNPMPVAGVGELIETLSRISMELESLVSVLGKTIPDINGRGRISLENIASTVTLPAVSSVSTVTSVSSVSAVTKVSQINGDSSTNIDFAGLFRSIFNGSTVSDNRRNVVVT